MSSMLNAQKPHPNSSTSCFFFISNVVCSRPQTQSLNSISLARFRWRTMIPNNLDRVRSLQINLPLAQLFRKRNISFTDCTRWQLWPTSTLFTVGALLQIWEWKRSRGCSGAIAIASMCELPQSWLIGAHDGGQNVWPDSDLFGQPTSKAFGVDDHANRRNCWQVVWEREREGRSRSHTEAAITCERHVVTAGAGSPIQTTTGFGRRFGQNKY